MGETNNKIYNISISKMLHVLIKTKGHLTILYKKKDHK